MQTVTVRLTLAALARLAVVLAVYVILGYGALHLVSIPGAPLVLFGIMLGVQLHRQYGARIATRRPTREA